MGLNYGKAILVFYIIPTIYLTMKTNRFETFMDAILAIIITVLVLKLSQPAAPTMSAVMNMNISYLTYFICFVIIFNTWHNDHNLFQMVDEIDNSIVFVYAVLLFVFSLLPYFSTWVALYPEALPAQIMFGLIFLTSNILYNIATYLVKKANPYNEELQKIDLKSLKRHVPLIIILIGFALSLTVYIYGIYISCLLATACWFVLAMLGESGIEDSERFEALFDAIIAIILTIIVLEITMASAGTWEALFEHKIEFLAYAISFIVIFNYWNFNNNLFALVHRIDGKIMWLIGATMWVLSLIPYLSTFLAENFNSFVPQFLYGLDFIAVAILSIFTTWALRRANPGNVALIIALDNRHFASTIIIVLIGMLVGYFYYPPAVAISCLLSILAFWLIPHIRKIANK